ncbi:MAG: hypothetical protein M1370_10165 [Bacteroidetes bacterium]|nr:hypothetical protein [Bacteroidota bacterium]MCL5024974.1 hypothetical protein [Chloroflexota bacterium]
MRRPDPDFNRLRAALMGGTPDRVPLWDSVTTGFKRKFMGRPVTGGRADAGARLASGYDYVLPGGARGECEFRLAAGYDYVMAGPRVDFTGGRKPKEGARIGHDANGATREWAPEGAGVIPSWQDFEGHPWPGPEDVDYGEFEETNKYLPEGMKIVAARGHIFTEVWELMGFETFATAIYEQPDLVQAIFDKVGTLVCKMIDDMLSIPNVGALRFNDDLAYKKSLLFSPATYRKYHFPWMRRAAEICRKHDAPFIYHCDGNITKVLDDLADVGVNALHPIDPTGLDIRAVRRQLGTKVCLLGNINQTYPLGLGTPEEVRYEALTLLRDIAPAGAYCLGSGHSVQDYVPLENYRAMTDTVREYGRYPIAIPEDVLREAEAAARASHRDVVPELSLTTSGEDDERMMT